MSAAVYENLEQALVAATGKHLCECASNADNHLCDDPEHCCETCRQVELTKWAKHFGLQSGMSREERRAQLKRVRPYRAPTEEDLEALRDAGRCR